MYINIRHLNLPTQSAKDINRMMKSNAFDYRFSMIWKLLLHYHTLAFDFACSEGCQEKSLRICLIKDIYKRALWAHFGNSYTKIEMTQTRLA